MPHWLIKAALQRTIGVLPFRHRLNELFQTYVTNSVALTEQRFEFKMDECRQLLDQLLEANPNLRDGFKVLELGPGWYPTVAVGMFLCGAGEVQTCDIAPLLRYDRVRLLLQKLCDSYDCGRLETLLPRVIPARVEQLRRALADDRLRTAEALLSALNIHILVADARKLPLATESIDAIVTIGVLLHIPRPILAEILQEFRRVGKPDMAQSHFIDMMDLFAYFDPRISPLNFLRFSDRMWKWIDNPIIPMNRLRMSDYRDLFSAAGFEITREIVTVRAKEADLDRVPLAKEFENYSREDLLTLMTFVVSRKKELADELQTTGAAELAR